MRIWQGAPGTVRTAKTSPTRLPPRNNDVRVLSYNIHKAIGGRDRRYRLDRVIDALRHEDADVICLQEVDRGCRRSRRHDQAVMISEALGLPHHLYQLNVHLQDGGYGNLIASRFPFLHHHQISLTLQQRKPRGAQIVVLETPQGPFHVVNCHLGLVEKERHWQIRRLLEHHLFRESSQLPTLIIGDTNDWRNTLYGGPFAVHDFLHVTAPPSRFRSFPAWMPLGALDKAFVRGPVEIVAAHVSRSRLLRDASDHLPLIIDLKPKPATL